MVFILFGMACGASLSCTMSMHGKKELVEPTTAPQESLREVPQVFHSEHYVLYIPAQTISAEDLAERYLGGRDRSWVIVDANGKSMFDPEDTVAIPLREENPGGLSGQGYQTVPVLCYSGFVPGRESAMHDRAETFERQMGFLEERGYRVVSLADFLAFLHYRKGLPEKAVVLTVDGADRAVYDIAFPVLRAFDYPAALFVPVEEVGAHDEALSWEQVREMKESGWEIGVRVSARYDLSNSCDPVIDPARREKVRTSLSASKQMLDEQLDQETVALAFPFPRVTPGILHLAQSLGYRLGVTARPGANPFFADPLALRREQVFEGDGVSFQSRLKTFEHEPLP